MKIKSLAVYCGTNPGRHPDYVESARAFGELAAGKGITLVYGGGNVGMMGAVADGALSAGGRVIGVMPRHMIDLDFAHRGLSEFRIVHTMHERKRLICDLADGFVALPGGFGTMEELFEMVTWGQLELHQKRCGLLNVSGYFDSLITFLRHMAEMEFLAQRDLDHLIVCSEAESLLRRLL